MSDSKHQLDVHQRYRVQRLIRMGEWLETNAPILLALFEGIDNAHTKALDEEIDDTLRLEELIDTQMNPLRGMFSLLNAIRYHSDWGAVRENVDVTLHHPCSCKDIVVIPADTEDPLKGIVNGGEMFTWENTDEENDEPNNEETAS